jgi:hypothetical protein
LRLAALSPQATPLSPATPRTPSDMQLQRAPTASRSSRPCVASRVRHPLRVVASKADPNAPIQVRAGPAGDATGDGAACALTALAGNASSS